MKKGVLLQSKSKVMESLYNKIFSKIDKKLLLLIIVLLFLSYFSQQISDQFVKLISTYQGNFTDPAVERYIFRNEPKIGKHDLNKKSFLLYETYLRTYDSLYSSNLKKPIFKDFKSDSILKAKLLQKQSNYLSSVYELYRKNQYLPSKNSNEERVLNVELTKEYYENLYRLIQKYQMHCQLIDHKYDKYLILHQLGARYMKNIADTTNLKRLIPELMSDYYDLRAGYVFRAHIYHVQKKYDDELKMYATAEKIIDPFFRYETTPTIYLAKLTKMYCENPQYDGVYKLLNFYKSYPKNYWTYTLKKVSISYKKQVQYLLMVVDCDEIAKYH